MIIPLINPIINPRKESISVKLRLLTKLEKVFLIMTNIIIEKMNIERNEIISDKSLFSINILIIEFKGL